MHFFDNSQYLHLNNIISIAYRRLLKMHFKSNCGHIGGNISCLDALMTLHHLIMSSEDRFVLSKGHAAGALYIVLWSLGFLSESDLDTFCQEGTALPGHPSGSGIHGLLFPTGSLGHGPSLASGLALGARQKKLRNHVYCLCSDGEWQEGSCWESLIFAVHHGMDNLTILVDQNGLQGFGSTKEVASVEDLSPRFLAFGASVASIDGHNPEAIVTAVANRTPGKPHIVVLNTRKGRGLPFEGQLASHYLPISEEQYEAACVSTPEEVDI